MRIITAPGGTTGDYSEKLNCCGGPLMTTHRDPALTKAVEKLDMPVFYLTRLVGLSMGMEPESLGLNLNKSPVRKLI